MIKEKFRGYPYVTLDRISHEITCSNCQNKVGAHEVARYEYAGGLKMYFVICPLCSFGSVIEAEGVIYPSVIYGEPLEGLTPDVEKAYDEARKDFSIGSHTSCQLICRKILMHVAIEKCELEEGKKFAEYIDALQKAQLVTPIMKPWVDKIRKEGNDATHKLEPPTPEDAENILNFNAQLLKSI